ncbi:hypothetical protein ACN077_01750 [Clostridium chromiireducens]|uniref:hypothetical protein n=1 Tax=Clostridium chromiireducens TaxID=225345 RepID=UPI003AF8AB1C
MLLKSTYIYCSFIGKSNQEWDLYISRTIPYRVGTLVIGFNGGRDEETPFGEGERIISKFDVLD